MITDGRALSRRLRPSRARAKPVLAPVAGLVCDGPFAEARDYAASVFAARIEGDGNDKRPAGTGDLSVR